MDPVLFQPEGKTTVLLGFQVALGTGPGASRKRTNGTGYSDPRNVSFGVPLTQEGFFLREQRPARTGWRRRRCQVPALPPMAQLHRTDKPVVLGLGATAIDYLATVEKFPQPDEKIRSRSFTIQGGGNVANTLTALARLGIASRLLTKLGDDAIGRDILADLEKEGIDTSFVVVKAQMTSPITYVIVDESTRTRTCIHTPAAEELTVADVSAHEALWSRVALVHLDSRHTLAALAVAREAVARGIPVVLDIEKNRPYAMELIALADYIITNATYPLQFSERASEEPRRLSVLNGLIAMLEYGRAQFVIGTQGAEGSLMVRRRSQSEEHQPLSRYEEETLPLDLPVLVRSDTFPPATSCSGCEPLYAVLRCPAWPVSKPIVDTTGAGDAYIAGIIYGLLHRMELARMMALASFVAAEKLTGPGARFALPKREHLPLALRAEATVSARDDLAQGLSKTG